MNLRTVLIVSPYFPPSTLAGVHRARHLAKHLPTHGWRPIIIRTDEAHYTQRSDPALAKLVPDSVQQVRTGAIPAAIARMAGIGDIGLRAYFHLRRAIAATARHEHAEAVFITGSPFYPLLLAGWIKRRLRLPVVLDFQDPWGSTEGAPRARWTKSGLAHRQAVALEPHAVRHADFITSVSAIQNAQMADRYSWLAHENMAAIPIGGDPEDFNALRVNPPKDPQVVLDPAKINLSYVGTFLPRAEPLVRQFFRALRRIKETHPALAARLRVNFVGTSTQPNGTDLRIVMPIAEQEMVADLISETSQRVPFLEALSLLANSNGLLLIGSDEPHYTASKIYPALMSGRPYLSLFHAASSAHGILSAAGGGTALCFTNPAELEAMEHAIAQAIADLATGPDRFGKPNPAAYAPYTARAVAGEFAKIFDMVAP